jgi:hypothetical protein
MFSPLAFPGGTLLYDLSTAVPPPSHMALSPFEQFREPLLIIGIGDASEYPWSSSPPKPDGISQGMSGDESHQIPGMEQIHAAIGDIKEQYSRAYLHSLMIFDVETSAPHQHLPSGTIFVPAMSQLKTTTMKTIMCDLTATLLAEMTTLARSIQALPTVASPASQNGAAGSTPLWATSDFASTSVSRRNSQTATSSRPESPQPGAQKDFHRMSLPVMPSTSGGPPVSDNPRDASPSAHGRRTPPTTFDEISGVNAANVLHQTNSSSPKTGPASKEATGNRVSTHGFGSGGVGERARNKGRGRISVVVGTLYMFAGQWPEAIRELTEGAAKARALSDHLWHAKALEHIMVCLLLFAWSGIDFQVRIILFDVCNMY